MSLNKWTKCIREMFDGENCVIESIVQSKRHLKVYAVLPNGDKRLFVTGITPSDSQKVLLNFRGDVRRAIKERESDERANS